MLSSCRLRACVRVCVCVKDNVVRWCACLASLTESSPSLVASGQPRWEEGGDESPLSRDAPGPGQFEQLTKTCTAVRNAGLNSSIIKDKKLPLQVAAAHGSALIDVC